MPQLQPPPTWYIWLFEDPTTPAVLLLMLSILLLWRAARRRIRSERRLALIPLGLLGVLLLTSNLITTQREEMMAFALHLAREAAANNPDAIAPLLHEDVTLGVINAPPSWNRDQILQQYEALTRRHPIASQDGSIRQAEILPDGSGQVVLDIGTRFTEPAYGQNSVRSTWLLACRPDDEGRWQVIAITWLRVGEIRTPALQWLQY